MMTKSDIVPCSEFEINLFKWLNETANDFYFINNLSTGSFYLAQMGEIGKDGIFELAENEKFLISLCDEFGAGLIMNADCYEKDGEFFLYHNNNEIAITPWDNEIRHINLIQGE